ncbi:hypothetical protein [Candidatus Formimonas warabiya]|uniref:Uncharacterized protein n=1 Tax=Formimonas warabiya TaxID=1761012 RepID=A0A3G1L0A5_FORW1|nr:hypothetical protein [Candidatus Formimonas warabiya]ATW28203.1 hypothetical protein DCMF_28680 [Candidatus Formimonas warabiya]
MRSAKDTESFPYSSPIVCYIQVDKCGEVTQISNEYSEILAAYKNAVNEQAKIYAVWPGNYRSDLFEIDNLDALADAFQIHGLADHEHRISWTLSPYDDGKSLYARVCIVFECGCYLGLQNIKKFAHDMKEQKSWDVATSKGLSGSPEYTIYVRRNSLR